MINIFKYLNLKHLSYCRGVCQQWLYDASNPASVYHVDTFYIRQLVDYFIDWERHVVAEVNNDFVEQFELPKHKQLFVCNLGPLTIDNQNYRVYIDKSTKYSNGIAKYNINLIKHCQSLTIDSTHWGKRYNELDCYSVIRNWSILLKKIKILKILLLNNFNFDLSNFIDINPNKILKSIKLIVTYYSTDDASYRGIDSSTKIQQLLQQLSWNSMSKAANSDMTAKNRHGDHDEIGDQRTNDNFNDNYNYVLNTKELEIYTRETHYSSDEFIKWFTNIDLRMVESLKLQPIACGSIEKVSLSRMELLTRRYFTVGTKRLRHKKIQLVYSINGHLQQIGFRNYFDIGSINTRDFDLPCKKKSLNKLNQDIDNWNRLIGLNYKHNMKVDGINLVMAIGSERRNQWVNVPLDLLKSQQLVNVIESLYKLYENGNISINLWFRVEHAHEENQRTAKIENLNDIHENLRKEKWIQLIVKATLKVFRKVKFNYNSDASKGNIWYLFDHDKDFPNRVKLLERVRIKLMKPTARATTLCLAITAK